jgi:hypothetical protein
MPPISGAPEVKPESFTFTAAGFKLSQQSRISGSVRAFERPFEGRSGLRKVALVACVAVIGIFLNHTSRYDRFKELSANVYRSYSRR